MKVDLINCRGLLSFGLVWIGLVWYVSVFDKHIGPKDELLGTKATNLNTVIPYSYNPQDI